MTKINEAIHWLHCAEINCDNVNALGLMMLDVVKTQIQEAIAILAREDAATVERLFDKILAEIQALREEVKIMATSTGAGLAALDQSVLDLTAAVMNETSNVNAATTAIASAVAALGSSEDPAVQAQAQLIETQVAAINSANGNLATAAATLSAPASAPAPTPTPTPAPAA